MIQIYNELKKNQNMIDKGQNVIPVSSAKILCPEKSSFFFHRITPQLQLPSYVSSLFNAELIG